MFKFKLVSGVVFVIGKGKVMPFLSMVDAIKWTLSQAIDAKAGL